LERGLGLRKELSKGADRTPVFSGGRNDGSVRVASARHFPPG
jgi:hypothetical protein